MPTYVYRRTDGTTFEVFQRITDDALTVDPETGQEVQRVIGSGAGLIFKGTGFYETDYVRKSGSKDSADGPKDASSKDGDSKSEAKPKGETKSSPASSDD